MKRRWEVIIGIIGLVLCLIFLGGFSLTITSMDESTFRNSVYPIMQGSSNMNDQTESFEAMKTFGVWCGISLLVVFTFVIVATLLVWKDTHPKWASLLYLFAGACTLMGTQLVAFPLAFIFFVVAGLCMFRKVGSRKKEGENYVASIY